MKAPIIVDNHGDTNVFSSVERAERYMEAADVEDGEYLVFDSEGHVLEPTVSADGHVKLRAAHSGTSFAPQLRWALIDMLQHAGVSARQLDGAALQDLLSRARTCEMGAPRGRSPQRTA